MRHVDRRRGMETELIAVHVFLSLAQADQHPAERRRRALSI